MMQMKRLRSKRLNSLVAKENGRNGFCNDMSSEDYKKRQLLIKRGRNGGQSQRRGEKPKKRKKEREE